jgi:hypothetical protein
MTMFNSIFQGRRMATRVPQAPAYVPPVRLEQRTPVAMGGWVQVGDDWHDIELIDLSDSGLGARTDTVMPIGEEVTIWLPLGGVKRAQVRWALGSCFGVQFLRRDEPLRELTLREFEERL